MSALPPKADIVTLFDHLVGNREHRRRHLDIKSARRLQVDGEIEFSRLLNGEVGRFGTLKDVAGVQANLMGNFGKVSSIAHQPTRCHHGSIRKSRRDSFARGQYGKLCAATVEESIGGNKEGIGALLGKAGKGCIDLTNCRGIQDSKLYSRCSGSVLRSL